MKVGEIQSNFALWADENQPRPEFHHAVYKVTVPALRMSMKTTDQPLIYVSVSRYGEISIDESSWWQGRKLEEMERVEQEEAERQILVWLMEWELVTTERVGPEDTIDVAEASLLKPVPMFFKLLDK